MPLAAKRVHVLSNWTFGALLSAVTALTLASSLVFGRHASVVVTKASVIWRPPPARP